MIIKYKPVYSCKCRNATHPHQRIRNQSLHGKGRLEGYRSILPIDFCCSEIEGAFEENIIKFGEAESYFNRNTNVNLIEVIPYPEGACINEHKIDFCPFCGKKIITEEV